jgi:pectate lyase
VELLGSGGSTNPVAPSVTTQPTNLTVAVGQSAAFSVVASGTAPLAYQWFFNATNALVNGTNATYTTNAVTTNNAGNHTVRVTNSAGAVTSSVAVLTITSPTAPSITTQPTNTTVLAGGSTTFTVVAGGTAPLSYQWFFNTNTALAGATNSSLTLANVQSTNAGGYSARVTNSVGAVTSSVVALTVTAVAPGITAQPTSQSVVAGGNATFTVTAAGTAPLAYQWFFNVTNALANGTNATYTTNSVTTNNAGNYSVRVTNSVGSVTSAVATLTISASQSNSLYNLYGFAQAVTGGGIVADTSATYAKVTNALSLATAVKSTTIRVIEIMNDLDLGWNEVGAAAQAVGPLRVAGALPIQHPALIASGVSVLDISRVGLTIFSANGARIRHCNFNIKSAANIIIRNLKFDEMWEWDEATKGNYDRNDWDFITIGNGGSTVSNVWIDHCTFTKAYDGDTDMKGGCYNITHSWNRYRGDDEDVNTNSFVWQQVNALEAGRATNTFYNFLRNNGFAITNIVTILHGHDKTHLIGATAFNTENASHKITFHHQWYQNPWDRLPRLRAGNVHNYNLFVEDSAGLDAKRLRDNIANAMSSANRNTLNNTYHFQVFLNGSISTEGGAVLVENSIYQDCLTPLRNNQTDVSNPSYTGKIMALNSIYSFRNTDGTTNNYTGASTNAPGDTYFGPVQAPVIAFSWNLTNNVLPYTYVMTDPTQLKSVLTNSATGCGSGVLQWNKTNWLKTSY